MAAEAAATGTAAAAVAVAVVAMTIAAAAAAAAGTSPRNADSVQKTSPSKRQKILEHSARNPDPTPNPWLVLLDEGLLVGLAGPAPGGYGRCRLVRPLGLLHIPPEDQHEQP